MSLRAILGGSRIKKRTSSGHKKNADRSRGSSSSAQPWISGLRQTKPGKGQGNIVGKAKGSSGGEKDNNLWGEGELQESEGDFFHDDLEKLDDSGLVTLLADDLSLRDVVQALRFSRGSMFDPMPQQNTADNNNADDSNNVGTKISRRGGGYVGNSTRVAELLNLRRRMPPLATTAHVAVLLPNATATERETVALMHAGVVRKVAQPQWCRGGASETERGGPGQTKGGAADSSLRRALAVASESLGEVIVETASLEHMLLEGTASKNLSNDTKDAFRAWLGQRGTSMEDTHAIAERVSAGRKFTINGQPAPQISVHMADELVRSGFLVGRGASNGLGSISVTSHRSANLNGPGCRGSRSDTGDVFARPEDRTTLLSLETVAKAASGSFDAVGGVGAVYTAGGGGARSRTGKDRGMLPVVTEDLMLAIPGHGIFIKLVSAALAHLVGILARMPYKEALESSLRERWDAGGGGKSRGDGDLGGGFAGFKRVPLSRTKKWKDLSGLSFDWVLAEALGAGLVELFDTGNVGRGVRLLS